MIVDRRNDRPVGLIEIQPPPADERFAQITLVWGERADDEMAIERPWRWPPDTPSIPGAAPPLDQGPCRAEERPGNLPEGLDLKQEGVLREDHFGAADGRTRCSYRCCRRRARPC
jgi:hypothetical protein